MQKIAQEREEKNTLKIAVSFYHNNAILISEFKRVQIDHRTLYALDFNAYSANGCLLEHNSKFVPADYVARRIKTCRKYHGTLTVARYYMGIYKITYQKDY